ncbi:MAG: CoA-binding protein [Fibrobacteres bacterium]|nr:CoA-binding protein [Fibrobacterota bacterium]
METKKEIVAILGASNKIDRYAYKAQVSLTQAGHKVIPVNPALQEIEGVKCTQKLSDITESVDTVTVYVRAEISSPMKEAFLQLKPKRVIFNPGTENPELAKALQDNGIQPIEACTLVMLRTNQF